MELKSGTERTDDLTDVPLSKDEMHKEFEQKL